MSNRVLVALLLFLEPGIELEHCLRMIFAVLTLHRWSLEQQCQGWIKGSLQDEFELSRAHGQPCSEQRARGQVSVAANHDNLACNLLNPMEMLRPWPVAQCFMPLLMLTGIRAGLCSLPAGLRVKEG